MKLPWTKPPTPGAKLNKLERAVLQSLVDEPETWVLEHVNAGTVSNVKATNRTKNQIVTIISWAFDGETARANCGVYQFGTEFANQWHAIANKGATHNANELHRKAVEREVIRLKLLFDAT